MEPAATVGDARRRRRIFSSRTILIVVGIVVSALFTYIAVRHAHPSQTGHALGQTNYAWLVPSLALLALAFFIRAIRWQSLFPRDQRPPLGPIATSLFVGYVGNAVLPARAGEAARTVALNKTAKTPIAQTVGTVFVERAEDVLSIVLLLFVMLPWLPDVSWLQAAGYLAVALILVLAVCAGILLCGVSAPRDCCCGPWRGSRSCRASPSNVLLNSSPAGSLASSAPASQIVSFAWTTLSWLVLGAGFWLV